jgi:beta-lactamase superfamily II metal-dependent hydrolase
MEQYKNRRIDVFRTDTHGAVRLISNGRKLSCRPMIGKPLTLRTNPAYMEMDPSR